MVKTDSVAETTVTIEYPTEGRIFSSEMEDNCVLILSIALTKSQPATRFDQPFMPTVGIS